MKNIKHADWYLESHVYVVLTEKDFEHKFKYLAMTSFRFLWPDFKYELQSYIKTITWDCAYFTVDVCGFFVLTLLQAGKPLPGAEETCGLLLIWSSASV